MPGLCRTLRRREEEGEGPKAERASATRLRPLPGGILLLPGKWEWQYLLKRRR